MPAFFVLHLWMWVVWCIYEPQQQHVYHFQSIITGSPTCGRDFGRRERTSHTFVVRTSAHKISTEWKTHMYTYFSTIEILSCLSRFLQHGLYSLLIRPQRNANLQRPTKRLWLKQNVFIDPNAVCCYITHRIHFIYYIYARHACVYAFPFHSLQSSSICHLNATHERLKATPHNLPRRAYSIEFMPPINTKRKRSQRAMTSSMKRKPLSSIIHTPHDSVTGLWSIIFTHVPPSHMVLPYVERKHVEQRCMSFRNMLLCAARLTFRCLIIGHENRQNHYYLTDDDAITPHNETHYVMYDI